MSQQRGTNVIRERAQALRGRAYLYGVVAAVVVWSSNAGAPSRALLVLHSFHNRAKLADEPLTPTRGQCVENARIDLLGERIDAAQDSAAFLGKLHRVRAGVLLGASALQ